MVNKVIVVRRRDRMISFFMGLLLINLEWFDTLSDYQSNVRFNSLLKLLQIENELVAMVPAQPNKYVERRMH